MSIQIINIEEFFDRLEVETDGENITPFTWLIGAGMSVSSGIPLAQEVSERIIIFEYWISIKLIAPWNSVMKIKYSDKVLQSYFDWFEENYKSQQYYDLYLNPAIDWLRTKPFFHDITVEKPECYQLLFEHLFQSSKTSILFLTNLIKRSKGINLAHLGLAGILKDYPKWGKTVFTTNFDDLLLKSILHLNYFARIFGEYDTDVLPGPRPNYPQIVHLHGKHTGYSMLNSKEQVSLVNPILQTAFKSHISDTNLLVIGYSGWDDLAMKTLSELSDNEELIRGNIYWVPWKSEETMLPQVYEFFDSLTSKVNIIVNEKMNLDADLFMIQFANFLYKFADEDDKKGNFDTYRTELLRNAEVQHSFILSELKKYPRYSPEKIFALISEADKSLQNKNIRESLDNLDNVLTILSAKDLADQLKAEGYLKLGKSYVKHNKLEDAEIVFTNAVNYVKKLVDSKDSRKLRLKIYSELTELHLISGNLELATEYGGRGSAQIKNYEIEDPNILIPFYISFSKVGMSKGYLDFNKPLVSLSQLIADNLDHKMSPDANLLFAWHSFLNKRIGQCVPYLEKSILSYKMSGNKTGLTNCKCLKANICIFNNDTITAIDILNDALEDEASIDNSLTHSNVLSYLGDAYYVNKQFEKAISSYQRSIEILNSNKNKYNRVSTEFDMIRAKIKSNNTDNYSDEKQSIKTFDHKDVPYVKYLLKTKIENSKKTGNEEE